MPEWTTVDGPDGEPVITSQPDAEQRAEQFFWPKVEFTDSCWIWTAGRRGNRECRMCKRERWRKFAERRRAAA